MRVGVTGATGRMGRTVLQTIADSDDEVAFAVSRSGVGSTVAGTEIEDSDEFPDLLGEREPDVVVDFSAPEASPGYATDASIADVPIVIGTTGFSPDDFDELEEAGEYTGVLVGANFARGVQALLDAVGDAAAALPNYDVELTETHHNSKRDAPSGTANVILKAIDDARGRIHTRIHGREGDAPRRSEEIGVHARRAGDITGEHEILLAGNHETLTITHRAGSRTVFAEGALDAAAWLVEADPGYYRFADIADRLA